MPLELRGCARCFAGYFSTGCHCQSRYPGTPSPSIMMTVVEISGKEVRAPRRQAIARKLWTNSGKVPGIISPFVSNVALLALGAHGSARSGAPNTTSTCS